MASISSLGIGSGLDLNTLLDNLSSVEQQRLIPYNNQQDSYRAKLSAYGTLKSALENLDNASQALAKTTAFTATKVSTHAQFSVTISPDAVVGSYRIEVTQLAQVQSLVTQKQVTDQSDLLGTHGVANRSVTLTLGEPPQATEIPLTDEQTSLVEIRDAINSAKTGVNASVMQVNENSYQLVLTSSTTGEASNIKVKVNNDPLLASYLDYDPKAAFPEYGMRQAQEGKNAKLTINGTEIERSTNRINDVLPGITIELKSLTKEDDPQILNISIDNSETTKKIQNWVDSYNTLLDTIASLSEYNPVAAGEAQSRNNGPLLGDSLLRSVQSTIKRIINSAQDNGNLSTLNDLGISTDSKTGKLTIDDEKLNAALDTQPEQFANFFIGNGQNSGIATILHNEIQAYIETDGILDASSESINRSIEQLNRRIESINLSIDATIERYRTQFIQLDTTLAKLNNVSTYLTQQFDSLNSENG